jgi:hypothetical protein
MLFYCRFTWYPVTSREEVARRVVEQDGINNDFSGRIQSWHTLVGGGAGFLMIEGDKPQDISEILEPYMDLMSWDVHAVTSNTYREKVAELKKQIKDM